jgi:hypothetical protein
MPKHESDSQVEPSLLFAAGILNGVYSHLEPNSPVSRLSDFETIPSYQLTT